MHPSIVLIIALCTVASAHNFTQQQNDEMYPLLREFNDALQELDDTHYSVIAWVLMVIIPSVLTLSILLLTVLKSKGKLDKCRIK
jgi:hypothetical protein